MPYETLVDLARERGWLVELGHKPSDLPGRTPLWWLRIQHSDGSVMHGARGQLSKVLDQITLRVFQDLPGS